jgi:imidazolonepropionase-like amidohydrolase
MRTLAAVLVAAALALPGVGVAAPTTPPPTVVYAAHLIDGTGAPARGAVAVTIRDGHIVAVEDRARARPPAEAKIVDLGGATLLPGLIDTHTHLFLQGEVPEEGGYDVQLLKHPLAFRAARATVSARRALEQGFTTLRDLETEGAGYGDVGIKQAIEAGYIPGPRLLVATRSISSTGGYPLEDYAPEVEVPKGAQLIDGPVEARKAAREQLDHGADWIKVYMTHRSWLDKSGHLVTQPTLTLEELAAIVDEAHGWGKQVACHAYNGIGLQRALDGGCDSIEHGLELTDAQIAQMVRQHTWYVPTLAVYYKDWDPAGTPSGERDRKRASVHETSFRKARASGVRIAFGTDMGGIPWSEPIAQEFGRMVTLGMTPLEAITAATSKAAELLGYSGELGVVAPGAIADLVAVADDPLADVSRLEQVGFVMQAGRVYRNDLKTPDHR